MLTIVLMIFIPYHRDILSNIYFYYLSKSPITEIYETVEKTNFYFVGRYPYK